MKNVYPLIIGALFSVFTVSCKTNVEKKSKNQVIISGKVVTKGAQTPLEGVGVFLGTQGYFVGGSIFDKTITDKDGNYKLILEEDQVGCHLMIDTSPNFNFVEITNATGEVAESILTEFDNQHRDVIMQVPAFVEVRISNLSGKYERIQGVLGHHPHTSNFFTINKGETKTLPIVVWGDDLDSFSLTCSFIDAFGQQEKRTEFFKVNVPINKLVQVSRSF